jgi:uncharacterized protein YdaU (DUF1376 family)
MNYYSHHIGDYLSATAHLSLLEHGVYRRLIDVYYIHEAPLPADLKKVYRLVGARTTDEKAGVDSILQEFFIESPEGWIQQRCDREIAITNKNRKNGSKGGRPSKNGNQDETQEEPKPEPKGNTNATQHESPRHPSPNHPSPSTSSSENSASNTPSPNSDAAPLCARLAKAGIKGANPTDPKLLALLQAGIPADEIGNAAEEPKSNGKGMAWLLAAVEGRRRDAAAAGTVPVVVKEWHETASGIESKAAELGLTKRFDEGFPAFKDRVFEAAGLQREAA